MSHDDAATEEMKAFIHLARRTGPNADQLLRDFGEGRLPGLVLTITVVQAGGDMLKPAGKLEVYEAGK